MTKVAIAVVLVGTLHTGSSNPAAAMLSRMAPKKHRRKNGRSSGTAGRLALSCSCIACEIRQANDRE